VEETIDPESLPEPKLLNKFLYINGLGRNFSQETSDYARFSAGRKKG
jgi:hypothetical protein